MKYIWMVFLVCLLSLNVACGDDKASDGAPSDGADATSNKDSSPDEDGDNSEHNEHNETADGPTTDTPPGDRTDAGGDAQEDAANGCQDRSTCSADEECHEGQCVPHSLCFGQDKGSSLDNTTCRAEWDQCQNTDEATVKDFDLKCSRMIDGARTCTCVVNDVDISTFETDRVVCDYDTIHRFANENCGWVMPKIY